MSICIFLVKYELDSDGAYIDGASDLLESVTLSKDLSLRLIKNKDEFKISQLEIFENESKNKSFEINCYLPAELTRLKERLREIFLITIRDSAEAFATVPLNKIDCDVIDAAFSAFNILTNLDALLTIKIKHFLDDESIVVRIVANE